MEIHDEYVTMLTPDGEFLKAKKIRENYQIGEEIYFWPINKQTRNKVARLFNPIYKRKIALISFISVFILLMSIIPLDKSNDVYAYISIDINPSFEIGLNEDLQVISLEALNEEGRQIHASISDWEYADIASITALIIEKSKEAGYLAEGNEVFITTVVNDQHKQDADKNLRENIEKISENYEKQKIAVTAVESSNKTRMKAKKEGLSTGKLIKIEKNSEKQEPSSLEKQQVNGTSEQIIENDNSNLTDEEQSKADKQQKQSKDDIEGQLEKQVQTEQKNEGHQNSSTEQGKKEATKEEEESENKNYEKKLDKQQQKEHNKKTD